MKLRLKTFPKKGVGWESQSEARPGRELSREVGGRLESKCRKRRTTHRETGLDRPGADKRHQVQKRKGGVKATE